MRKLKLGLSVFVVVSATLGTGACSVLVNNKKVLKKAQKALTVTAADSSLTSDLDVTQFRSPYELAYARTFPTLIEITGGRVMILGGSNTTATEIFDPAGNSGLGTLSMGPSLNVLRTNLSFTKLNDGRILAAGGYANSTGVVTVEIFDPTANSGEGAWSLGPDLPLKRYAHTATKLNDGRVLLAGGRSTGDTNTSVIFDATANSGAGSWTNVPSSMPAGAYYGHEATLLPDGRVMASGGTNGGWPSATAIFNPAANAGAGGWSSGTSMGVPRWLHQTTVLPDGRVLFTGGTGASGSITSVEFLDPTGNSGAGSWSAATALPLKQSNHRSVLLDDGRVLHVGSDFMMGSDSVLIFDPTDNAGAGSWTPVPASLTSQRDRAAVHKLANGKVLLVGGQKYATTNTLIATKNIEVFDPAGNSGAGSWQTLVGTSTVSKRISSDVIPLDDGRILFLNGTGLTGQRKDVTFLDPSANDGTGEFVDGPSMDVARFYAPPIKLKDGRVMVAGGDDGISFYTSYSTVQIFDPAANSGAGEWSAGPSLPVARSRYIASVLSDGRVVLLAGYSGWATALTSTVIFDPEANSGAGAWQTGPSPLDTNRLLTFGPALIPLPDAQLLLFGGQVATAEIFDPDANAGAGAWAMTGSTNFPRLSTTTIRLSDDRVLTTGGMHDFSDYISYTVRDETEIYDPSLGTWNNAPAMLNVRYGHGLVEHPNGLVYAFSGYTTGMQSLTNTMESFDPAANSGAGEWSAAAPTFDPPLYVRGLNVLSDGRILIHGSDDQQSYAYLSLFETTTLSVTGGIPPYTAGILSGQGSLKVNSTTGSITLMPTDFGNIKIQVTDGRGVKGTVEVSVN
ncbi:MAG TPA: hypothetical protein VM901_01960 [Bdellovibrionota bacterium]|jgi:hypothetical protein|nr:hypothetical protein [Bdellovibrionota bacterium]